MSTTQISKVRATLLAIIFAGAPLLPASHAQDLKTAVIVNVPFAFQDGSQHFTAGRYTISMDYQHIATIQGESVLGSAKTSDPAQREVTPPTHIAKRAGLP
jgi:hypothetical protein